MNFHRRISILLIISLVGLMGCSKKDTESQKVDFVMTPSEPIVINADLTIPDFYGEDDDLTVNGPYFKLTTITATNSSTKPVVISVFNFIISTSDGKETRVSIDAGAAGEDYFFYLVPEGSDMSQYPGATEKTDTWNIGIYIGNLPKNNENFRYRIEVEPVGWFGTPTGATDRFIKTFFMYTQ